MIRKIKIIGMFGTIAMIPTLLFAAQLPKSNEKIYSVTFKGKTTSEFPKLKATEIWSYEKNGDLYNFENGKFERNVLHIKASDTSYSLLILNGKVSAYIYDTKNHIIWEIKDLTKKFSYITLFETAKGEIKLVAPGGDMRSFWVLDFSKIDNLTIRYYEEYDIF